MQNLLIRFCWDCFGDFDFDYNLKKKKKKKWIKFTIFFFPSQFQLNEELIKALFHFGGTYGKLDKNPKYIVYKLYSYIFICNRSINILLN